MIHPAPIATDNANLNFFIRPGGGWEGTGEVQYPQRGGGSHGLSKKSAARNKLKHTSMKFLRCIQRKKKREDRCPARKMRSQRVPIRRQTHRSNAEVGKRITD